MLIVNIKEIFSSDIADGWLRADGATGLIIAMGPMDTVPEPEPGEEVVDARGGYALPSFCDSHTHIVFACTREAIERSL